MKSFGQLHLETHEVQFDFLVADLRTAFTFLDVAKTTQNDETRTRNLQHATEAYAAVERFFPRVEMTEQQRSELQEKLRRLKERIHSFQDHGLHENSTEG